MPTTEKIDPITEHAAAPKWKISFVRFGVLKVSRPNRPHYYVFPREQRCTCRGWSRWGRCSHLRAALAFLASCERAQREREAAARRKARGVSAWAFDFLFA